MPLDKFTLVHIDGLQSQAGKKFNYGLGLILSNNNNNDSVTTEDEARYPVRIFALANRQATAAESLVPVAGWTILRKSVDKKLKAENLHAHDRDQDNRDALTCLNVAAAYHEKQANDIHKDRPSYFWLEANFTVCPEDWMSGMNYVSKFFRKGKIQEAAEVAYKLAPIIKEKEDYLSHGMIAKFLCEAQLHMETAVELAFAIPLDNDQNRYYREETLSKIIQTLKAPTNPDDQQVFGELLQRLELEQEG